MKVHVVVPARIASTRLPRKPLAPIAGVPMIVRVARQAAQAAVDDVTVAVDDRAVLDVVEEAGHRAVMTRVDHPSGSDRVKEVADLSGWQDDDLVINVQGDEPLLPPAVIDALATAMARRPEIDMGTVSEPLADVESFLDPNVVKVAVDANDNALYFSRAPIPFPRDELNVADPARAELDSYFTAGVLRRHVGMYAFRVRGLARFVELRRSRLEPIEKLEQLRWLEAGYPLFVLAYAQAIPGGVDTPEDLARVEAALSR